MIGDPRSGEVIKGGEQTGDPHRVLSGVVNAGLDGLSTPGQQLWEVPPSEVKWQEPKQVDVTVQVASDGSMGTVQATVWRPVRPQSPYTQS